MNTEIQNKIERIVAMLKNTVNDTPTIAIAGAHAKGQADPSSDIDIYLFTDDPKSYTERLEVIRSFCDANTTPWVSQELNMPWGGSMDFTYEGTPVEVVIRLFSHMEQRVFESLLGHIEIIPQTWTSNGYYSYIFLSELSFLKPLCDPNDRLTKMKASVQTYPPKLKAAIIETFMGRAWTWIQNFHYDTAVMRADTLFTAPIVLHTILDLIQVIFAINEEYFTGDKKLLQTLSKLAYCPKDLLQQLDKLLTAAPDAYDLKEQQQLLYKIFFDVKEHLPL